MKIAKKLFLFSLLTVGGCQLFEKKATVSQWDALKSAQKVECFSWPKPKQDIDVTQLNVVVDKEIGFISQGRSRRMQASRYFVPFTGNTEIKLANLKPLKWHPSARYLGSFGISRALMAVLETPGPGGKKFEVHDIKTGKLLYSGAHGLGTIDHISIAPGPKGFWFAYKRELQDASWEDQPSGIGFASWQDGKGTLSIKTFPKVRMIGNPALLASQNPQELIAVWLDTGTSESIKKPSFKMQVVRLDGAISNEIPLNIPLTDQVESWSAFANTQGQYLAYIDGDSMLGKASLKVARLQWGNGLARINWVKTKSLLNEHTATPVWIEKNNFAYVVILKWLDGESTGAAYKVTADDVASLGAFGVFKEGTALEAAFADQKSNKVHGITKRRKGAINEYSLCRFESL